eukprot:TRINITY_DN5559_c0_g1_i1.p1 TRINITY_DN5559_c0_g1~~TRINITY_DN5559_c0_g1_i1.p1  ORF type:complete len:504 (+),score=151.61 TRINITY_DN5559_c0_g1_i1:38-1513(+)
MTRIPALLSPLCSPLLLCLLLLLLLLLTPASALDLRLAVIGSGVSGTGTALMTAMAVAEREDIDTLHVDIFESELRTGGRLYSVEAAGGRWDVGATSWCMFDQYARNFAYGLPTQPMGSRDGEAACAWDGSECVDTRRLMGRTYARENTAMHELFGEFAALWDENVLLRRRNPRPYESYRELLGVNAMINYTQKRAMAEYNEYEAEHFSEPFPEFVRQYVLEPYYRLHYGGQMSDIHEFASEMAMARRATDSTRAEGGNDRYVDNLLARLRSSPASARLFVASAVQEVQEVEAGSDLAHRRFHVHTANPDTRQATEGVEYDAVVLAAPIEAANVRLSVEVAEVPPRHFLALHCTLVAAGRLSPLFFGLPLQHVMPPTVVSTSNVTDFYAIEQLGETASGATMFRILSPGAIDRLIVPMFEDIEYLFSKEWKYAYPSIMPGKDPQPFRLAHGLYYTSGAETMYPSIEGALTAASEVTAILLADFAAQHALPV